MYIIILFLYKYVHQFSILHISKTRCSYNVQYIATARDQNMMVVMDMQQSLEMTAREVS